MNSKPYIIAEIGINHNGDINIAKKLIDMAKEAGCDSVKFQKRDIKSVYTEEELNSDSESPWGKKFIDQKLGLEFEKKEYDEIDNYCRELEIDWFASLWDIDSLNFLLNYEPPVLKIASASITNKDLLIAHRDSMLPIIMSTGMSTPYEIHKAYTILKNNDLAILHTTSTYPCPPEELNLNVIKTLIQQYPNNPIGYSGHESGLSTSIAAAVLGAKIIERHITLNRAMWGTDQAASLEPIGMQRLVGSINNIITALGDGKKKVYESEISIKEKLRNIDTI